MYKRLFFSFVTPSVVPTTLQLRTLVEARLRGCLSDCERRETTIVKEGIGWTDEAQHTREKKKKKELEEKWEQYEARR